MAQLAFYELLGLPAGNREAVEAGVLVGDGGAEKGLDVAVVLGRGFGEVGGAGVELGQRLVEELQTIVHSSFLGRVEVAEAAPDAGAIRGRGFYGVDGVVDGGGNDLEDGLGGEVGEGAERGYAEVWVQSTLTGGLRHMHVELLGLLIHGGRRRRCAI